MIFISKQRLLIKQIFSCIVIIAITNCEFQNLHKGSFAPDFKMTDIQGKTWQLSAQKGKIVMLHFWTDWCNSCRREFPLIQHLYSEIKTKNANFELIAINVGQAKEVSQKFQQDFNATFPMLIDKNALSKELYAVKAFPTNYFINAEGKIIRKIVGWVTQKQVEVIIQQNQK